MNRFTLFIFLVLCSAISIVNSSSEQQCGQNALARIQNQLSEIDVLNGKNPRFPETHEKLLQVCRNNAKVVHMATGLVDKCMHGFKQNLLKVVLYSIRSSQKTLCRKKPTAETRAFTRAGVCVNSGRQQFRKCAKMARHNIYGMRFMPEKLKIPLICCELYRLKDCFVAQAKNVKECTQDHIDALLQNFNSMSGNSMSFACGEYTEDSDRCDSVHPPKNYKSPTGARPISSVLLELIDFLPGESFET